MFSESCSLPKAGEVVDLAETVVINLQQLRDGFTDEQWETVIEQNPLLETLIDSIMDLESSFED